MKRNQSRIRQRHFSKSNKRDNAARRPEPCLDPLPTHRMHRVAVQRGTRRFKIPFEASKALLQVACQRHRVPGGIDRVCSENVADAGVKHVHDAPGADSGGAESTGSGRSVEGVGNDVGDFGVDGVIVPEVVGVVLVVFGLRGPVKVIADYAAVVVVAPETGVTEAVQPRWNPLLGTDIAV